MPKTQPCHMESYQNTHNDDHKIAAAPAFIFHKHEAATAVHVVLNQTHKFTVPATRENLNLSIEPEALTRMGY